MRLSGVTIWLIGVIGMLAEVESLVLLLSDA